LHLFMSSRARRNIYIVLTVFCISGVIALENISNNPLSYQKELSLNIDKEKVVQSPYAFILSIITLIYMAIFLTGIINLGLLIKRKLQKKSWVDISEKQKAFFLSEEKVSKLFFLLSFFVLIIYLLSLLLYVYSLISLNLFIALNVCFETGIVLIILRFIKPGLIGFALNKKHLVFLLRTYSLIVPIILGSLLVNILITEKLGMQYLSNPAIELLFFLRGKISLFVMSLQIIALGPLAEELLFRGFIYKFIRTRYSFAVSSIIISIFFSLLHQAPQNILPLFVISMALCYVYEKTQNILTPIIFHSLHNLITLFFFLAIKPLI